VALSAEKLLRNAESDIEAAPDSKKNAARLSGVDFLFAGVDSDQYLISL
jgi:hypothetical protein